MKLKIQNLQTTRINCVSKPEKMPGAVCELSFIAENKTENMGSWGINRVVKKLILWGGHGAETRFRVLAAAVCFQLFQLGWSTVHAPSGPHWANMELPPHACHFLAKASGHVQPSWNIILYEGSDTWPPPSQLWVHANWIGWFFPGWYHWKPIWSH